ncbi:MAG TPA: phosphatase PAP2 family protein [Xylella taiwanensis]
MPVFPVDALVGLCRWLRGHSRRSQWLFFGVLLPLALFVVLAVRVYERKSFFFDLPLLYWMRALASPDLDTFFVTVTEQGYRYGVVLTDASIVLMLLGRRYWHAASFAVLSLVGSRFLNIGAKHFFQRERPDLWEAIVPAHGFSFPSAHAMDSMTMVAVLIALLWDIRWRGVLMVLGGMFVLLLSISRIYFGVHYPSDIFGGWSLALVWVAGLYLLMFRDDHRPRLWRQNYTLGC